MKKGIAATGLLCLLAGPGARADKAAATACAASLQPHARLVFDAVTASPEAGLSLRVLLEATVRELVFMDRLMRSNARPAAEAASECLKIARNCTGDKC
jgi:hypothetical protein